MQYTEYAIPGTIFNGNRILQQSGIPGPGFDYLARDSGFRVRDLEFCSNSPVSLPVYVYVKSCSNSLLQISKVEKLRGVLTSVVAALNTLMKEYCVGR